MKKAPPYRDLAIDLVVIRDRLMRAGLWETMQLVDRAIKRFGWELAEQRGQSPALHRRFLKQQAAAEAKARRPSP